MSIVADTSASAASSSSSSSAPIYAVNVSRSFHRAGASKVARSAPQSALGAGDVGETAPLVSVRYNFKPPSTQSSVCSVLYAKNAVTPANGANGHTGSSSSSDWTLEVVASGGGGAGAGGGGPAKPSIATPSQDVLRSHVFHGSLASARDVDCVLVWDKEKRCYALCPLNSGISLRYDRIHASLSSKAQLALKQGGSDGNLERNGKRPRLALTYATATPRAPTQRRPSQRRSSRILSQSSTKEAAQPAAARTSPPSQPQRATTSPTQNQQEDPHPAPAPRRRTSRAKAKPVDAETPMAAAGNGAKAETLGTTRTEVASSKVEADGQAEAKRREGEGGGPSGGLADEGDDDGWQAMMAESSPTRLTDDEADEASQGKDDVAATDGATRSAQTERNASPYVASGRGTASSASWQSRGALGLDPGVGVTTPGNLSPRTSPSASLRRGSGVDGDAPPSKRELQDVASRSPRSSPHEVGAGATARPTAAVSQAPDPRPPRSAPPTSTGDDGSVQQADSATPAGPTSASTPGASAIPMNAAASASSTGAPFSPVMGAATAAAAAAAAAARRGAAAVSPAPQLPRSASPALTPGTHTVSLASGHAHSNWQPPPQRYAPALTYDDEDEEEDEEEDEDEEDDDEDDEEDEEEGDDAAGAAAKSNSDDEGSIDLDAFAAQLDSSLAEGPATLDDDVAGVVAAPSPAPAATTSATTRRPSTGRASRSSARNASGGGGSGGGGRARR